MRVFVETMKTSSEDIAMAESELERKRNEREQKLRKLLERVEQMPRSLQLAIQGELNQLVNQDPSRFIKQLISKENVEGVS